MCAATVEGTSSEMNKRGLLIGAMVSLTLLLVAFTQLSFFVVQPIGAVPEGRTLVMLRGSGMQFVDSADAMCERIQGGVSLLCRGMALGQVVESGTILMRRPYSHTLYSISSGGREYSR